MSAVLSSSKEVPNAELEIVRLTGHIGAQVQGIRLSGNLPADIFKSIQSALYAHKVLFFRNQEHLDDAAHQEFGRLWGPLEDHPTVPSRDGTRIFELDSQHGGRANSWHTDVTFEVAPPQVSILRAVVLPTVGGDTVWANTAYAYAELSPSLKSLAEELWAIHSNDYDYAATRVEPDPAGVKRFREVFKRRLVQSEHPLVRVHPVTGERTLVAGHFLKKFIGYNTQDSNHLFAIFQNHITRLENTVRWRWQTGDVAIWDNRATQHYAVNDYGEQHRVVRRVTVSGEATISVDGRPSRPHAPAD